MFRKLRYAFLFVLASIIGTGCDNELDTNADWKEIMVIYGLLNTSDTTHYIRVTRAFLNDQQSALEIAKIADSLYFDSVKVEVTESGTGRVITFHKDFAQPKEEGIFATIPNIVYSSTESIYADRNYTVKVTNVHSGNTATGTTNMVSNPTPGLPSTSSTQLYIDTGRNVTFAFTAGLNGAIYDCYFRFYWDEFDQNTNAYLRTKSLDWRILQGSETSVTGKFDLRFPGVDFFNFLAENIPVDINVYRKAVKFDVYYWGANDDYLTYSNVNEPSVGIVQKKPDYTNISNGNYGLFASRNRYILPNLAVDSRTLQQLNNLPVVEKLNFQN